VGAFPAVPAVASGGPTLTWTGQSGDGNWSNAANWNPAQVPSNGDALAFPSSGAPVSPSCFNLPCLNVSNDLPGLSIADITVVGNGTDTVVIGGLPFTLTGGAANPRSGLSGLVITNDLTLPSGNHLLEGTIDLTGALSGLGGVEIAGPGNASFSAGFPFPIPVGAKSNTYSGGTTIDVGGALAINKTPGAVALPGTVTVAGDLSDGGGMGPSAAVTVQAGGKFSAGASNPPEHFLSLTNSGEIDLIPSCCGGSSHGPIVTPAQVSVGSLVSTATATLGITLCGSIDSEIITDTAPQLAGTLTFSVLPFSFCTAQVSLPYTVIHNTSSNPITTTFAGLPEGSIITVGGFSYPLHYNDGTDGNDVTLGASPPIRTITSITPNTGPTTGGTQVAITGSGFSITPGQTTFLFGDQPATGVSCSSTTSCTAVTPPERSGAVSVRVTVNGQPGNVASEFTYIGCATAISGGSPSNASGATVEVRAIEVNQVVQDWCNSVTLIESKPTLVRVHMQTTNGSSSASASVRLTGARNGSPLGQLTPMGPGHTAAGPVTASSDANSVRSDINRTANFLLPASWLSGTVTLTVQPAPGGSLACADLSSVPSACKAQVTFHASPTLHLTLVDGDYPDPTTGVCIRPGNGVFNDEIARLYQIFPVAPGHIDAVHTTVSTCLPNPGAPAVTQFGPPSWSLDQFLGSGEDLAHSAWDAAGQPNRFFATLLVDSQDAWYGTTGQNRGPGQHDIAVWHVGNTPPFSDPWFASRYELGHELMHGMGIEHPGSWIDQTGTTQPPPNPNTGLCGTDVSNGSGDTAIHPSVTPSDWHPYSFDPGMQNKYPYTWAQTSTGLLGGYPNLRAYALGPMVTFASMNPDAEIYGANTDAFIANDNPHRIVVDPHHTFDMMSYCWGTYPPAWQGGASKFQWITSVEYQAVFSYLGGH
jgi:hypothetical protein